MQRGSAQALRGIIPRLGGVGWAASLVGFVTVLAYNLMLGLCLYYFVSSLTSAIPWDEENLMRPISCQTAEKAPTPPAEIFFYMNATKFYGENSCDSFLQGIEPSRFSGGLFISVALTWIICFLCVIKGARSISVVALGTATIPFVLLFILMGYFIKLNNSVDGKGIEFYFGTERFARPG